MILRSALLFLSRRQGLRRWVETSPVSRRLTKRFVAGQTLDDGLAVCGKLNAEHILATLDHLGENVTSPDEVKVSRDAYLEALRRIAEAKLKSTVSIKLTQFGLDLSEDVCHENVNAVVEAASRTGNSVEIDMESSEYVDRTLRLATALHDRYGCVRAVIQTYLRRSEDDIMMLCRKGVPVRLCKGAYQAQAAIAYTTKEEVDQNYRRLIRDLLVNGVYPAVATHDETIINEVIQLVQARGMPRELFEFQMLYGIRRSLQRKLVRQGFRLRLYVPYGAAWYPYFMRRLAEHPANLVFLVKNLLRR
jgi:proline dehydrogenase